MAARPLLPQCSQQENERLFDVLSAFVDWNAPEIYPAFYSAHVRKLKNQEGSKI